MMERKKVLAVVLLVSLLGMAVCTVQADTFAVQANDHVNVCNDSSIGPDSTRKATITDVKNFDSGTAQRRRVGYYKYDISAFETPGAVFSNCYLTLQVDKGDARDTCHIYTYAIKEELDDIALTGLTWNTAPGVDNNPTPALNSQITIDTLDTDDISPLLATFQIPTLDVWLNTATYSGLDDALNADTDGNIILMFIAYDTTASNGFEICSPSHSRAAEPVTGLKGIILRGDVIPEPATMLILGLGSLMVVRRKRG